MLAETCYEYPQEFICPITCEVMKDPVVAQDGFSYERTAIIEWLKKSNTSPLSRIALNIENLIPNRSLKTLIEEWRYIETSKMEEEINRAKKQIKMDIRRTEALKRLKQQQLEKQANLEREAYEARRVAALKRLQLQKQQQLEKQEKLKLEKQEKLEREEYEARLAEEIRKRCGYVHPITGQMFASTYTEPITGQIIGHIK